MNYGQIFYCDIANGVGCRTALFVSGCTHHCKGCFNEETWDFKYGEPYTKETEDMIIERSDHPYIDGITLLGGEPMEPANQLALMPLIERVKNELTRKTIWIYSGYLWEELADPENQRCHTSVTDKILSMTDILVDGEFHLAEKNISLRFRGSSNQRIIDVQESLKEGRVILSKYMDR